MITTYKCRGCNKEFTSEYHHGGAIEHNNKYSNWDVTAHRYKTSGDAEALFRDAINLSDNYCMRKDHTYSVGVDIYNCCLNYMLFKGHVDIYEYLKSREKDIIIYYRNELALQIKELEDEKNKEIAYLQRKLRRLNHG